MQDPDSNWQSDRDHLTPIRFSHISLAVPLPRAGTYTAQWWDTRRGVIVRKAAVTEKSGESVKLTVPPFTRDIAVRLVRNAGMVPKRRSRSD
jgi:hypothetical protein